MRDFQNATTAESTRLPRNSTVSVRELSDADGPLFPVLTARWGRLCNLEVNELKRHGNRRTVEIKAETAVGRQALIGKFYDRDRVDVFHIMQRIYQSGFGSDQPFYIPQPLAFISEQGLLLLEKIHGRRATDAFLSNDVIKAAECCGRWLAHFHKTGPTITLRPRMGSQWLDRIASPARQHGVLSDKERSLLETLRRMPVLDGELCGCHGSYSHCQILIRMDGSTVVFDWDKYCVADPASDIGNFIVGLKQLALSSLGSINALDDACEIFLKTYTASGGYEIKDRLQFYLAGQCFRRAQKQSKYGSNIAESLIDEGFRFLSKANLKVTEGSRIPAARTTIVKSSPGRIFSQLNTFCMFIGFPRSGHSLIGALLDAHPNMIIAHELHVLKRLHEGFSREEIYSQLLANSRSRAETGRGTGRYSYAVANQYQGQFKTLRVIGDKQGGGSTSFLAKHPAGLNHLKETIATRVKFICVLRNPFDNITTLSGRKNVSLEEGINHYFSLCEKITVAKKQISSGDLFELKHESFIEDPEVSLSKLCSFLGEEAPNDYLRDCAGIVRKTPHKSRHDVKWKDELITLVEEKMARYDFLNGYSFESS